MCRQIQQSSLINSSFECSYVNLSTSRRNDEVNRFSSALLFRKGMRFISSFLSIFWQLLVHRPDIAYMAITCHGIGFLKDAPFVLLCKLFRCKIILHQHNKGIASLLSTNLFTGGFCPLSTGRQTSFSFRGCYTTT